MKRKYIHKSETHRLRDAEIILPLVFEWVKVSSVVDVGCGTGTFLKGCENLGIRDYLGIDGEYVDRDMLQIPPNRFMPADLSAPLTGLHRRFDLVICLEVAEHIAPEAAEVLVTSLVELGDVILFSAAIPGQGGQHHLNEQWPSYWVELFRKHNYEVYDLVRERIWSDERVFWWYKQNTLLVAKASAGLPSRYRGCMLNVVHPELWRQLVDERNRPTLSSAFRRLIKATLAITLPREH